MINSDAFSAINVLDKAADASWTRESAIANNLANIDTPGYKRQDVNFQSVLEKELRHSGASSLNEAVKKADISNLNASVYTDSSGYSYRLDGNNVDVDTENVELASEQLRYQGLTTSMTQQFNRFKSVIN